MENFGQLILYFLLSYFILSTLTSSSASEVHGPLNTPTDVETEVRMSMSKLSTWSTHGHQERKDKLCAFVGVSKRANDPSVQV